jgi:hypothetical protein
MPVGGKANLGPNFYAKLVKISEELGMKPEDLLAVMTSESGLNPSAYEEKYKGSGLIGFMPATLRGLGYQGTWQDFIKLSGEEQLDWVKKFIQGKSGLMNGRKFTSAGLYYTGNLWPIALKLPGVIKGDPSTRILESNPDTDPSGKYSKKYFDLGYKISAKFEKKAYEANPLFDHDKKGYITYGDMIKQTEINRKNPAYQKAVATMAKETGYQPGKEKPGQAPPSMVAQNDNHLQGLDSIMDKYLQEAQMQRAATTHDLKRLYKRALPTHNILICISAPDYSSAIEFSNVLTSALDEELLSNSYPHTDGHDVEIECTIAGPEKECVAAVRQMTQAVVEAFKDATAKIGGINVITNQIMNKKSSYQPISPRTADTNHRKFLLKFI